MIISQLKKKKKKLDSLERKLNFSAAHLVN